MWAAFAVPAYAAWPGTKGTTPQAGMILPEGAVCVNNHSGEYRAVAKEQEVDLDALGRHLL